LPRQLGEAVGPGARVGRAVELLPLGRVGEPVVGAAVDDEDVLAQPCGDLGGPAVRQREEHDVMTGELGGGGLGQDAPGQGSEMGMVRTELGARVGARRQRADLELWMSRQDAQQLAARVSAGAGDRRPDSHVPPAVRKLWARVCITLNVYTTRRRPCGGSETSATSLRRPSDRTHPQTE